MPARIVTTHYRAGELGGGAVGGLGSGQGLLKQLSIRHCRFSPHALRSRPGHVYTPGTCCHVMLPDHLPELGELNAT